MVTVACVAAAAARTDDSRPSQCRCGGDDDWCRRHHRLAEQRVVGLQIRTGAYNTYGRRRSGRQFVFGHERSCFDASCLLHDTRSSQNSPTNFNLFLHVDKPKQTSKWWVVLRCFSDSWKFFWTLRRNVCVWSIMVVVSGGVVPEWRRRRGSRARERAVLPPPRVTVFFAALCTRILNVFHWVFSLLFFAIIFRYFV